jgi:hypothetical protein
VSDKPASITPFSALPDIAAPAAAQGRVRRGAGDRPPATVLPDDGPGAVIVTCIGSRLRLSPTTRSAGIRLAAVIARFGSRYDHKRRGYTDVFAAVLRRGAAGIDSVTAVLAMEGLAVVIPDPDRRAIARYRRQLERQMRPIPRAVWRDDEAAPAEVLGESDLAARGMGWRPRAG